MDKRVVIILQARCGSTRLPKKALKLLAGTPMLRREIDRVRQSKRADALFVATTEKPEDDAIEALASEAGVESFRGSELDVLDRFYHAALEARTDIVVRITGDCPLHDPEVIDSVIGHFVDSPQPLDYTITPTNYPEGFDTEVFTFAALERAWREAKLPSEREHVTPYIRNHLELFAVDSWIDGETDDSTLHLSVDTHEDFAFVSAIWERLGSDGRTFGMHDIVRLIDEDPAIAALRPAGTGYEGYEKSLRQDAEYDKNSDIQR